MFKMKRKPFGVPSAAVMARMAPCYDKDTGHDDGGTLEAVKAVGAAVEKVAESAEETTKKVETIAADLELIKVDGETDMKAMAAQVNLLKSQLANRLGASGAEDWLMDMSKFIGGVYASQTGRKVEGSIGGEDIQDLVGKAAVDFSTTTAATAGYLLPSLLLPGITELKDIYGNFYPAVTKVSGTPGQTINMNQDNANPVAYWRAAQNTTITEEATPYSLAQDSLVSILCGSYVTIGNEMLNAPGVNFSAVLTVRMLKAILRKLEFGMIAGTTGAGEPSDGLIADATDQGTIASMTWALLIGFIKSCINDNDYAFDTMSNAIIMTPFDALTLAGEQSGSSGALVWGDPEKGTKSKLMGYDLIVHPAANNGSSKHILLGDPSMLTLVESSAFSVDISAEAGSSFVNNQSILRAFNHYDWNIGQATEWHKAVVTA